MMKSIGSTRNRAIALTAIALSLVFSSCSPSSSESRSASSLFSRNDTYKSAFITIQNSDQDGVRQQVYREIGTFEAAVEEESWNDQKSVRYRGTMRIKLPSQQFLPFVDFIKSQFSVQSFELSASEQDSKSDAGKASGVVHSPSAYVTLTLQREIGFGESFAIGVESASQALELSLQTIVPVIVFLAPYTVVVFVVVFVVRFVKRKRKQRKSSNAENKAS